MQIRYSVDPVPGQSLQQQPGTIRGPSVLLTSQPPCWGPALAWLTLAWPRDRCTLGWAWRHDVESSTAGGWGVVAPASSAPPGPAPLPSSCNQRALWEAREPLARATSVPPSRCFRSSSFQMVGLGVLLGYILQIRVIGACVDTLTGRAGTDWLQPIDGRQRGAAL